jgi:hypothetical protein
MKDPKLLVSEGASDFERRWLSAARAEEPPAEVVSRIERALGIGGAAAATGAVAPAVVAKGGLSALRIAGLSVLGVGGAVGLVLLLTRPTPTPSTNRPPPVVETAPAPAIAPSVEAPAADQPQEAGALRDEIALIDGARAALSAGSPAQALTLLERYRARHPRGMLLPEALAMRIEAIDRSGDHARAQALARAFLADYPHTPLAQRIAHIANSDQR